MKELFFVALAMNSPYFPGKVNQKQKINMLLEIVDSISGIKRIWVRLVLNRAEEEGVPLAAFIQACMLEYCTEVKKEE